jgi:hypothetical protein
MPEPVVHRPALRIAEDLVRSIDFLETDGSGGIVRVAIRMVLSGEFPEGRLDLLGGGTSVHAQDLVMIALWFCHVPCPVAQWAAS